MEFVIQVELIASGRNFGINLCINWILKNLMRFGRGKLSSFLKGGSV
jgi:hypothetical protein